MSNIDKELETIKKKLKGNRCRQIRSRCKFLIECIESGNVSLTANRYGHPRQSYYRWLKNLRSANYDINALRDKSRVPKTNPRRIDPKIIKLAIQIRGEEGLDAPTVAHFLKEDHDIDVHASTLGYIFKRLGKTQRYRITNENRHKQRYAKEDPLEQAQTDTTNLPVVDNNGHKVRAYPVIDDCTRSVTVHVADEHSGNEATKGIKKFFDKFGVPSKVQTDWGSEFTYEHLSENKKSEFDQFLESEKVSHILIKPGTPQLNGKVERFNKTLKRHLRYKLRDGMTIAEIQGIVDKYVAWYNRKRPHRSLKGLTPHEKFYGPRIAKLAS